MTRSSRKPTVFLGMVSVLFRGAWAEEAGNQAECEKQIVYESDTDGAYKFLEEAQRQIYTRNPGLADPYSRAELASPRSVATFAELKARALEACPDPKLRAKCALDPDLVDKLMSALPCVKLATRFEAPIFSSLVQLHTKELDSVRLSRFPDSPVTRFGSLPTGTFDAQAVLPPGSKVPLVILNRDLFFFTGAFSKAISDAIPIKTGRAVQLDYSDAGILKRLRERPYIVNNFADAMSRLVKAGSSAGAQEVTLDEDHNHLHARLVSSMDSFLISHEEAHVILEHLSGESRDLRLVGARKRSKEESKMRVSNRPVHDSAVLKAEVRTRTQELDADKLGFRLMVWMAKQDDPIGMMVAAAAPHMVFRVLDAANAYGTEAEGWTFKDANHPSASERIRSLAPVFDEVASAEPILQQVDFRVPFDAAFKVLLAEADPQIRRNLGLEIKKPSRSKR